MRPIRLEFAGLHSYREPQSLDFSELLEGGLFGIFGPTGSGKSTILDAITLALFGTVGRAKNNTQGILNHAEKELYVRFTFALRDGSGERRYRVERRYVRDKHNEASIRSAHCRLVEVAPEGETVLADKERDVTAQVVEILGLTADDFTRAVVLPQGKFAEFLQLSGRERRQMLERIFSLSQYGDRLNQRLRRRIDEVTNRLEGVEGEQRGLGDASDDAVAAAEQALAEAERLLKGAEAAFARAEQEYRAWEKVWELQQERSQVEQQLAGWREREPVVRDWREELDLAQRAEQIRHPLQAERQAREAFLAAEGRLAEAIRRFEEAAEAELSALAAFKEVKARREQEAPVLMERRLQLRRAAQLELDIEELTAKAENLAKRVAKGKAMVEEAGKATDRGDKQVGELKAALDQLYQQQADLEVPAERRAWLAEALKALRELEEAEKALREAHKRWQARQVAVQEGRAAVARTSAEYRTAREKHEALERELAQLEAEPPATEDDLRTQAAFLSRAEEWVRAVEGAEQRLRQARAEQERRSKELAALTEEEQRAAAAETWLRSQAQEARGALEKAQAALEEARRQDHVAAVQSMLVPGEPCPVCGSREHPQPADAGNGERLAAAQAAYEQAMAAVQQAERELEAAVRKLADVQSRAAAARERAAEVGAAVAEAEEALAEARGRLPEAWRSAPVADLPDLLEREAAANRERSARYQAWRAQVEEARRRRDEQAQVVAQASSAVAAQEATLRKDEEALGEAAREVEAARAEVEARRSAFDQVRDGLDTEGLRAEEARVVKADQEMSRLRRRQEALRKELHEAELKLAEVRRKHQEYTTLLHQRELESAQAQQALAEAKKEHWTITSGQKAEALLQQVEAQLKQLDEQEAAATRAREDAEKARTEAASARAAAQRERELAAQRLAEAEAALKQGLQAAGFATAASAEAALRSPERRAELAQQVEAYEREGDRLAARSRELEAQLGGRSLTAEEWAAHQSRLEEARTALAERRDERTRAAQVCQDLKQKQARWKELEAEREALAKDLGYLNELQRLLRGNAFVEFLAEEQMSRVAQEASARLGQLTRYRYALETSSDGGFVIRDDGNGGTRRPVNTLSGGETFLTSLALALALSAQIQLRGHYPLEFFFLDEGFGTLDPELLDLVITTLERLHFERLHVGVISHVPELRNRLQRRVIVEPAEPGGRGSRLTVEHA